MFIPVESALTAAMETKPPARRRLENKVLIATPTLLIGLLRTAAYGWRQEAWPTTPKNCRLGQRTSRPHRTFVGHLGAAKSSRDRRVQQVGVLFGQSLLVTSQTQRSGSSRVSTDPRSGSGGSKPAIGGDPSDQPCLPSSSSNARTTLHLGLSGGQVGPYCGHAFVVVGQLWVVGLGVTSTFSSATKIASSMPSNSRCSL